MKRVESIRKGSYNKKFKKEKIEESLPQQRISSMMTMSRELDALNMNALDIYAIRICKLVEKKRSYDIN